MAFEVRPTGLRPRHPLLGVVAALLIGAAIVSLGLAARSGSLREPAVRASPVSPAPLDASSSPADLAYGAPFGSPPGLPKALDCRDVTRDVCARAALAALGILPPGLPAVTGATVWHSLLCSILPDCPPQLLTLDSLPLGSVIISFADAGPEAWINVVDHVSPSGGSVAQPATAWIVRWH